MVPDDFILLATYTWFLRCIPTAVCRRHWSCAKLEQWDWVIWPRRECRGREGRRIRELKWSWENWWKESSHLKWVNFVLPGGYWRGTPKEEEEPSVGQRKSWDQIQKQPQGSLNNGHHDVFPSKPKHYVPYYCIYVMENYLRKQNISITDEAPMDERNA